MIEQQEFKNNYAKLHNYLSWSKMEQDLCDTNHAFVLVYRFHDMMKDFATMKDATIKSLESRIDELQSQIVTNNLIR